MNKERNMKESIGYTVTYNSVKSEKEVLLGAVQACVTVFKGKKPHTERVDVVPARVVNQVTVRRQAVTVFFEPDLDLENQQPITCELIGKAFQNWRLTEPYPSLHGWEISKDSSTYHIKLEKYVGEDNIDIDDLVRKTDQDAHKLKDEVMRQLAFQSLKEIT